MTSFIIVTPTDDVKAVDIDSNSKSTASTQFTFGTGLAFGSEYVFNSANTNNVSVASLTSTKFVVAYVDNGNSDYGTAVIGEVSGNTITYGAEYVFNSAGTNDVSVAALNSTKFVVAFNDSGNFGNGTAVIGDVSGNTISYGSGYVFNILYTTPISVASLTSTKFVVAYGAPLSMYGGLVRIGDVSGNSITYGDVRYLEESSAGINYVSVTALLDNEFMVVYDGWVEGCMAFGDVFGNHIHMEHPRYFETGIIDNVSITTLAPSEFLITYSHTSDTGQGKGLISRCHHGTWFTPELQFVFNPDATGQISASALSSTEFVIAYEDVANSNYGTAMFFERLDWDSGWAITYSSEEYVFNPDTTSSISVADLSSFVIAYEDTGNSGYGTAIIGNENQPPNIPDTPDGPPVLGVGESGTYNTSAIDSESDQVQYRFDWDANGTHDYSDWTSLDSSGHIGALQNYWTISGTYVVKAQARDENNILSNWSSGFTVNILNPPLTPSIPSGLTSLKEHVSALYITSAIDPDDDRVQYRFDWDDGIISGWTSLVDSGQPGSMSHSWNIHGTYYVRAQARDEHGYESGWSGSLTVTVIENEQPVADADGPYTGTINATVQFDGSGSYDPDGIIVSYDWDFGDGESSSVMNPSHEYDTPDTYTVTLTVEDNIGQTDTDTTTAGIFTKPNADANGPYEGIVGKPVDFNGSASDGVPPYKYHWNFGDGVYSSAQNPSHTYYEEGEYTVSLRVTDDNDMGYTDNTHVLIYLSEAVVTDAGGPYSGGVGQVIAFTGNAVGGVTPYTFEWDLDNDGDYDDATGQSASKSWSTIGTYTIGLKVTDNIGTTDTDTTQVSITSQAPNKPSKPSGPTSGKAGTEYTYTSSTTDPDDDDVFYLFDWDDGTDSGWLGPYDSGDTVTASHTWTEEGDYQIKVKAKDEYDVESPWSDPLPITMPKNKAINPFLLFLERLMERFPILEQILQPIYDKLTGFY